MTFRDPILKQELSDKWSSLQSCPKYAGKLAKPFFGYAPTTFSQAKIKILYIGKVTAGAFCDPDSYEECFGCNNSMFWSFARRLGKATGDGSDPLGNIAWSNLCKIGTISKNPDRELATEQQEVSVKILKSEIAFLNPSLIVCVAADTIYDNFLYQALGTERGLDGFIDAPYGDTTIYVRSSVSSYPPILWMHHPQGRDKGYLAYAESQALQLLAQAN